MRAGDGRNGRYVTNVGNGTGCELWENLGQVWMNRA